MDLEIDVTVTVPLSDTVPSLAVTRHGTGTPRAGSSLRLRLGMATNYAIHGTSGSKSVPKERAGPGATSARGPGCVQGPRLRVRPLPLKPLDPPW